MPETLGAIGVLFLAIAVPVALGAMLYFIWPIKHIEPLRNVVPNTARLAEEELRCDKDFLTALSLENERCYQRARLRCLRTARDPLDDCSDYTVMEILTEGDE